MQAFGAARLDRAGHTRLVQRLADQLRSLYDYCKVRSLRRIEIEHEVVGVLRMGGLEEGDVVLHGTLVGEPEQRTAVVTQGVRDFPSRRLRPDRHPGHPVRCVLGKVLLHEPRLAWADSDDRQRPVSQAGKDASVYGVEVVDQVPLCRARPIEQFLIQVGKRDVLWQFASGAHGSIITGACPRRWTPALPLPDSSPGSGTPLDAAATARPAAAPGSGRSPAPSNIGCGTGTPAEARSGWAHRR